MFILSFQKPICLLFESQRASSHEPSAMERETIAITRTSDRHGCGAMRFQSNQVKTIQILMLGSKKIIFHLVVFFSSAMIITAVFLLVV